MGNARRVRLLAVFVCVVAAALAASPRRASAQTPHVAVIHVDPATYGPDSFVARQQAAQQFYASHRDAYDFLVVFPAFPIDRSGSTVGEAEGRHFPVRSVVSGIGAAMSDLGPSFGSPQRLLGFIDDYALVPGDGQDFESALAVVAHETAHQWSGMARFLDRRTGQPSNALLGLEGAHWSYFLDSEASVLYGAQWLAAPGGTYTSAEAGRRYSALDLYLMGFLAPNELAPITLLQPSSAVTTPPASLPPAAGTTISASPLTLTLADLVAAMGPRVPASSQAQTSFRAAFVVVAAPGQTPTPAQLAFVDSVRREWANRFFYMTRGRGVMETELVERPPSETATHPSIQLGVDYLRARQTAQGAWADDPATAIRDTQLALEALSERPMTPALQASIALGFDHLAPLQAADVDDRARQALGLRAAHQAVPGATPPVVDFGEVNRDGGVGLLPGYRSTVIDTALATLAAPADTEAMDAAVAFLGAAQHADGGWGLLAGSPSDIGTTSLVLQVLARSPRTDATLLSVGAGLGYLALHRGPDGNYREDETEGLQTAEAVLALASWDELTGAEASQSAGALLAQQQADGSWGGAIAPTALALRALRILTLPNPAVLPSGVALFAASATEGEQGSVYVLVQNTGAADAVGVALQAFDSNGVAFGPGVTLPLVRAGSTATATLAVDTTGHAGSTQLFVVVDPQARLEEASREDDRAVVPFVVNSRPTRPDLWVAAGSLTATPAVVTRVGDSIAITARVGNLGVADVPAATVALRSGATVLSTTTVALPGGSLRDVTVIGSLGAGANPSLSVVVDPENLVVEDREDNNVGATLVQFANAVDLAVHVDTVSPTPVDAGRDLTVRFEVTNTAFGASVSTPTSVAFLDAADQVVQTVLGPTVAMQGGATVAGTVVWRASSSRVVAFRIDVPYPADLNPANNSVRGGVEVRTSSLPNLAFQGTPTVEPSPPLEGSTALVTADVYNTGETTAPATDAELFVGDPAHGGRSVSRVSVSSLAPHAHTIVALPLLSVPATAVALTVQLDPDGDVSEFDEVDNLGVVYVEPLTAPDLALQDGSIAPANLFPRRAEHVQVRVDVDNLGGQASAPAVLELFRGAPESGGELVGQANIPSIASHGRSAATFDWDTGNASGVVELVAVVNRDHASAEGRSDNDRASRSVVVQDGDVAVSNPYFSPDGDGVKDVTEVFYRLPSAGAVRVDVQDERGRVVRTLQGVAAADGSGSVLWDGRASSGRLAYDGLYQVSIAAEGADAAQGQVAVVLDTNRSSVLESPRELLSTTHVEDDFVALLPADERGFSLSLTATPDESAAVYRYWHFQNNSFGQCRENYYRVPLDGSAPLPLMASESPCGPGVRFVSPDGLFLFSFQSADAGGAWTLTQLEFASGNVTTLPWPSDRAPLGASRGSDGESEDIVTQDGLLSLNFETGAIAPSRDAYASLYSYRWAPDGSTAVRFVEAPHGMELRLSNVDGTGDRAVVVEAPRPLCVEYAGEICVRWEATPIPTPAGAVVLDEGASLLTDAAWVSPTEIAYYADGLYLLDLASGEATLVTQFWDGWVGGLLPDPSGRNVGVITYGPGAMLWSVNLASHHATFLLDWPQAGYRDLAFTPFATAVLDGEGSQDGLVDSRTFANLGLIVTGARPAGSTEFVFRGTAADANFESWALAARPRGSTGPSVTIATGTGMVLNGELARWTAPQPGTWEVVLTGRDLAGNTRSVSTIANWAEVPAVANVRAEPRFFSPNGDGRSDLLTISYSVQEPVSTAFTISRDGGAPVRTMPVAHPSIGDYSLAWDGRDAQGVPQPDGSYVIAVAGSRSDVVLDTIHPEVALSIDGFQPRYVPYDLHPVLPGGLCTKPQPEDFQMRRSRPSSVPVAQLAVNYRADDEHLATWSIEGPSRLAPATYLPVMEGEMSTHGVDSAAVMIAELPGNALRMRGVDAAGNESASQTVNVPESLIVTAFGAAYFADGACSGAVTPMAQASVDVTTSSDPFLGTRIPGVAFTGTRPRPRLDAMFFPEKEGHQGSGFCYRHAYHAFAIEHTIREQLLDAAVVYARKGDASFTVDHSGVSLSPLGAILWDARQGPDNLRTLALQVTDVTGRSFTSAPIVLGCGGGDDDDGGGGGGAGDASCLAASAVDRIDLEHLTGGQTFDLRDTATGALRPLQVRRSASGEAFATVDASTLDGCGYDVVVADGASPSSLATAQGFAGFDVCGLAVAEHWFSNEAGGLRLFSRYRKPVSRMDLYLTGQDGQPIFAKSVPGFAGLSDGIYLDMTGFYERDLLELTARTFFTDGTSRYESSVLERETCGKVSISRPPVKLKLEVAQVPAPLCAGRAADVRIEATAESAVDPVDNLAIDVVRPGGTPVQLTADPFTPARIVTTSALFSTDAFGPGVWSATARNTDGGNRLAVTAPASFSTVRTPPFAMAITSPLAGRAACPAARVGASGGVRRALPVDGVVIGRLARQRLFFRCGADPLLPVATQAGAGALGEIDVTSRGSADCELMVEGVDASGASYCSSMVPFHLVGNGHLGASVAPGEFSPNGDGVVDGALLAVETLEPSEITVVGEDSRNRTGVAVRLGVPSGASMLSWDGTIDGAVAADGDVKLHVTAVDPCGATTTAEVVVQVDNTPPLVRIDSPAEGARIGGLVVLEGEIADPNLLSYDLSIGAGTNPTHFERVASSDHPARGVLGEIPTSGFLPGPYVVQVVARDRVGNARTVTVPVEVTAKQLINAFQVDPPLVSPNGDGLLDTLVARYELLEDSVVALEVVDPAGTVLGSVLPSLPAPAGPGTIPIPASFLSAFEDGSISLRLTASAGPLQEFETAMLTIDRLAPELEIDAPAAGAVVVSLAAVTGSIRDDHLESWDLHLVEGASLTRLAGGSAPKTGVLAPLAELPEGEHGLQLEARDRASNHFRLLRSFTIDRTAPQVALTSPAPDGWLTGLAGPVDVTGEATDAHLARVAVSVERPNDLRELTSVAAVPAGGRLLSWDVAHETDGTVDLRLDAIDAAGNTGGARVTLHLDSTLPVASLTVPLRGFLPPGGTISGTATDDNLASWTLELCNGTPSPLSRWLQVAGGTQPVEGALTTLLGLADGTYGARLRVRDLAGNESAEELSFQVDTTPPYPPASLVAHAAGPDVALSWAPSPDPDVVGYRVLRATGPIGSFAPIGDVFPSLSAVDPGVRDGSYRYVVIAVDAAGLESSPSSEAALELDRTPPRVAIVAPAAGAELQGIVAVTGTAWSLDFAEYRLSIGAGADPASFSVVRRSTIPVLSAKLGEVDLGPWPDGSVVTLRLQAEDLHGNVAEARVTVTLDGTAPRAPVLVSAAATGTAARLTWLPSPDADVIGYLVYRNGTVANAPPTASDVRAYLLPAFATAWDDASLPDGDYAYQVQAIDRAGSPSPLSNSLGVTVETEPPRAVIASPAALAHVDGAVVVAAEVQDLDVASVQLQVRAGEQDPFQPLGAPLTRVPFQAMLDSSAFLSPILEVRAVATDRHGNTDPAPVSTFLFHAPAMQPPVLTATVTGSNVALSWTDPNPAGEVSGFEVARDGTSLVSAPSTLPGTASASASTSNARFGADGNVGSAWIAPAAAPPWWQLDLDRPALVQSITVTPYLPADLDVFAQVKGTWVLVQHGRISQARQLALAGGLEVAAVRVVFAASNTGTVGLYEVKLDPVPVLQGLSLSDLALPLGTKSYQVTAVSAFGVRGAATATASIYAPSLDAPPVAVGTAQLHVTGAGAASNSTVTLLRGSTTVASVAAAADGSFAADVSLVEGSNVLTARARDAQGNQSLPSASVTTAYESPPTATVWLSLTSVTGGDVRLALTVSGSTTHLSGFHVRRESAGAEPQVTSLGSAARTVLDSGLPNGTFTYTVVPLNARGLEGTPSNAVAATVSVAPLAAPTLTVDVVPGFAALRPSWGYAGPVGRGFVLERALEETGPFTEIAPELPFTQREQLDAVLTPGARYFYRVHAVDSLGNAGLASLVASAVAQAPPVTRPVLVEPTGPGFSVNMASRTTDVAGFADPGARVELRRGDIWMGQAVAGELTLRSDPWTTVADGAGFGVSPDGAWEGDATACCGEPAQLWVWGPDSSSVISDPTLDSFGHITFSTGGRNVAFEARSSADGRIHVFVASTADGTFRAVSSTAGEEWSPAWSPDGRRLAYEVLRDGSSASGIGVLDLATGAELTSTSAALDLGSPGWSATGQVLALARPRAGGSSSIVELDGSAVIARFTSGVGASGLSISPDGAFAAIVTDEVPSNIVLVDLMRGTGTKLGMEGADHALPTFTEGGRSLVYVRDTTLVRAVPWTGEETDLGPAGDQLPASLAWTDRGLFVVEPWGSVRRLLWGGPFRFPGMPLAAGDNFFTATAFDVVGQRSAVSEPISVWVAESQLPDVAVSGVVFEPEVAVVGDAVGALVTVQNLGGAAAPPTSLSVSEVLPDGTERWLPPVGVGQLAPGATLSAMIPLGAASALGRHVLTAIVDPAQLVPESNRQNNLARAGFSVVSSRSIQLALTVAPTAVPVNGVYAATVTVQNPGGAVEATILTRLVDSGGAPVLESSPVHRNLAAGTTTTVQTSLPAGTILAGAYAVDAELHDSLGHRQVVSVPVVVQPERSSALALSADRYQYFPGEAPTLASILSNGSRNAPLVGATHRVVVHDATGTTVWQSPVSPLPTVWMGGATTLVASFATEGFTAGEYTAVARVELEGVLLAEATIYLLIAAQPDLIPQVTVAGAGDPPAVVAGVPAAVTVAIDNAGTAASSAVTARLALLAPRSSDILSTQDLSVPAIAASGRWSQTVFLPTAGLALDTYGLAFATDSSTDSSSAASARFRVADGTPPRLAVLSPAAGSIVRGAVVPVIEARDAESGVTLVRAGVGLSTSPLTLTSGNALDGVWSNLIPLGPDGAYTVIVSAADAAGNDGLTTPGAANPVAVTVVSDTLPPTLHVEGVANGALVREPVTFTVTATDLHLAMVVTQIDDLPYTPGTMYAEDGEHVLRVVATDQAGNKTVEVRSFDLDLSAPDIVVSGVYDGQYSPAPVTPVVTVSDRSAPTYQLTLDGAPWSGGTVGSERHHLLVVDARDSAGNTRHLELGFWIDLTNPTFDISGVTDGACSATPVTPVVTAQDANLESSSIMLEGQRFDSGTIVTQDGVYSLFASAADRAGRQATRGLSFTIDSVPPVLTLSVENGRYYSAPVTVSFDATDASSTTTQAILDGGDRITSGTVVAKEGRHTVAVEARDCAGHTTPRSATFTVDLNPPALALSGVDDGAVVSGPVAVVAVAPDVTETTLELTLDDFPYDSGTPITIPGAHTVRAVATDAVGHVANASLSFGIADGPPPDEVSPYSVFSDQADNGFWIDTWGGDFQVTTQTAHRGTTSITLSTLNSIGLAACGSGMTQGFTGLEFWINGGSTGGQSVVVSVESENAAHEKEFVAYAAVDQLLGGPIPVNGWQHVVLPFVIPTRSEDVVIRVMGQEEDANEVLLDDIALIPAVAGGCTGDVGSPCSDGNACNGEERCDGAGHCLAGLAPSLDDGNPCTLDACDPQHGPVHTLAPAGASCTIGPQCASPGTCSSGGVCAPASWSQPLRVYDEGFQACFYGASETGIHYEAKSGPAHAGTRSLFAESDGTCFFADNLAGSFGSVELWVSTAGDPGAHATLAVQDSARGLVWDDVELTGGGTWQRVHATFEQPSTPGWMGVCLVQYGEVRPMYIDDVKLDAAP